MSAFFGSLTVHCLLYRLFLYMQHLPFNFFLLLLLEPSVLSPPSPRPGIAVRSVSRASGCGWAMNARRHSASGRAMDLPTPILPFPLPPDFFFYLDLSLPRTSYSLQIMFLTNCQAMSSRHQHSSEPPLAQYRYQPVFFSVSTLFFSAWYSLTFSP